MNYETIDEFGYDIVLGFKQNAFRRNGMLIFSPSPRHFRKRKIRYLSVENGYCGAFLMGLALHDSWIKQLENTTMPTVLLTISSLEIQMSAILEPTATKASPWQ